MTCQLISSSTKINRLNVPHENFSSGSGID